ncbi:MAG: molybdopterin molybdotransferase MoeA [Bacteroidetes bacterium]|nr:molybdopterin molybdotransferase MoeA [Bacteroidota bacterium]
MIEVKEAIEILKSNLSTLPNEKVIVPKALGKYIAEDIISPMNVPSFDNSAMDGYAISFVENNSQYYLESTRSVAAGDTATHVLQPGKAMRIFTGAPIPKGADTVVQQELVSLQNGTISVDLNLLQQGSHIRYQGTQCKAGQVIVKSGTFVNAGVIALLSSVGITEINVVRKPRVGLVVTGNELVQPGNPLKSGQVYNSNEGAVFAFLQSMGIPCYVSNTVKDDSQELTLIVRNAIQEYDVLILTGGISVGDFDFTYNALSANKVETLLYKVKQKPGKPLYVGKKGNTLIFALPGNPAAVISCFNQYVKPSLKMMMGGVDAFAPSCLLPLALDWTKNTNLTTFLKAKVSDNKVEILKGQDSFDLQAFGEANALIMVYENEMAKQKGDLVEVYYL